MYLFDTNVLSEITKRTPSAAVLRKLVACAPALRFASEMTRYELRRGALLHPNGAVLWAKIEARVLPLCTWLPVDDRVSLKAAELNVRLRRAGLPIDWTDPFLAATALVHGLVVVTRNLRHFERVVELPVENWFPA